MSDTPATYWNIRQVREHFGGVSRMWIHRRYTHGDFPKPIYFDSTRRFWRIADVLKWENENAKSAAPQAAKVAA